MSVNKSQHKPPLKFHIILDFKNSKGGGTSFLSFLKSQLIKKNMYTEQWYLADSILVNSHHISKLKALLIKFFPLKKFRIVHRIDGPMRVYNHRQDLRDDTVVWMNRNLADATVFQSEWSYKEHEKLYGKVQGEVTVIPNAANPNFFKPTRHTYTGGKLKLISTVWSQNINKGYETYKWLDEHLDFSKFSFELVGGEQERFKNVQCLPHMKSEDLALKLEQSHAFIFPSRFEACSNALLEALTCGLPCVAYGGSSNVEIIKNPKLWFSNGAEIIDILNLMIQDYESYMPQKPPSAEQIVDRYIEILKGKL